MKKETNKEKIINRILIGFIIVSLTLSIGMFIILLTLQKAASVGKSMEPTIQNGNSILVSKLYFDIEKGDIIIAHPINSTSGYEVAKRVVATEGDHVYMHDGKLYINDKEDVRDPNAIYDAEIDLVIPKGCYYILGDNRNVSYDSRGFGYITEDEIVGKVISIN